jgi:hypothetical protein
MITSLQITSEWFSNGIPRTALVAPWQPANLNSNTMRPDFSGKVHYSTNSLGYRDTEWTDSDLNDSVWCVGHSDTMGLGVDIQSTYQIKLQSLLATRTINLGIAGASYDTFSRVIASGLKRYKPKHIILQATTKERKEYITDDFKQLVLPSFPTTMLPHNDVWRYSDESTATYDFERNISLIQYACEASNVKLTMFDLPNRWDLIKSDPAHDNQHIGPKTHTMISEYLYSVLST